MEITTKQLDGEHRTVCLFIETAKTYIQLATGALLLSVTFSQEMTGKSSLPVKELSLWIPWLSWLMAILTGSIYQYCAAKYLQILQLEHGSLFNKRPEPFVLLRHWTQNPPSELYGALLIFFYGGTIWFAVAAAYQLTQ